MPRLEYDSRFKQTQRIKVGTSLIIQVDFTGFPAPSANWCLNGTPLSQSQRVSVDQTEYYTTLTVRGMSKDDVGNYSVNVKNQAGSASANFDIKMRGKYLL